MSTKIYNAYKFKGDGSKLMDFCRHLRELNKEDGIQNLLKYAPKIKIIDPYYEPSFWDRLFLTRKMPPKVVLEKLPLINIYDYLEKLSVNDSHRPHPLNMSGAIVAYFHEGNIYVQLFLNNGLFKKVSDEFKDLLEDYHYQNQVDMSNYDWDEEPWENMSKERQKELEEDWEQREYVWSQILDEKGVPSDNGLTYELFSQSIGYDITDEFFNRSNNL